MDAATLTQIKDAGFRTREKLISMGEGSTFPANLNFITSDCDRNTIEIFIAGFGKPAVSSVPVDVPDLRAALNRPQSRQSSSASKAPRVSRHRNRHHSSSSRGESSNSCSGSQSRSRSSDRLALLSRHARNLPCAHKFVLPKSNTKGHRKIRPTDISGDEFLCYNLRTATRLASTVSGKYASALVEFLEYQNSGVPCGVTTLTKRPLSLMTIFVVLQGAKNYS